jgi:hypothetical protein
VDEQQKKDVLSLPVPQVRMARVAQPWQLRRPRLWPRLHLVFGCIFAGLDVLAFMYHIHIYLVVAVVTWVAIVNFAYSWLMMVIAAGDAKSRRNKSP